MAPSIGNPFLLHFKSLFLLALHHHSNYICLIRHTKQAGTLHISTYTALKTQRAQRMNEQCLPKENLTFVMGSDYGDEEEKLEASAQIYN